MSTAVFASAAAGGIAGGLVVLAVVTVKKRATERRLLRRLEAAFTRLSGPQASSVFDTGLRPEVAVERIEEAIERLESSNTTALESLSTVCRALDEVGVAATVYNVSGECVHENRSSRVLLDRRFPGGDLRAAAESLVSKSLWNGESLTENLYPEGAADAPWVSIRVSPLDGDTKRLGVVALFREVVPREDVGLMEVCHRVASALGEAAAEQSVTLTVFDPPPSATPSPVSANAGTVFEACRLLVENSLSQAVSGSVVEIGAARIRDETWLWVADELPAQSERDLETIFEPTGSGSDLAVVRYLAELNGANLDAASIDGKGRRFTLRFATPRGE